MVDGCGKRELFGKYSFPTPLLHKKDTSLTGVRLGHMISFVLMVVDDDSPSLESGLGHVPCLVQWDVSRLDAIEILQRGLPFYTSIIMMGTPTLPRAAAAPVVWNLE